MKIAGIAGATHPTLKRGEPIALSPEKKVEAQAKEGIFDASPEGIRNIPIDAKTIGHVTVLTGRRDVTPPEPGQYSATVAVSYRPTKLATDKVFPVKIAHVAIICKDSKDQHGIPDLETVDFKIL